MSISIDSYNTFAGFRLMDSNQIESKDPVFILPSADKGYIPIDYSLLSKHIMLLGGIGTGKTNTINFLIDNIRGCMGQKDVMMIFDPKGDYYDEFYREGDIVISNDEKSTVSWNIFEEVLVDDRIEENINEIATYFYEEKIARSSNPFFPSAARDIFASLISYLIRGDFENYRNNKSLRSIIDSKTSEDYIRYFSRYGDLRSVCSYIADDAKGQTQGVMSEFIQTLREILVGNFKKKGDFSIRRAVREKGGKVIFVEYDLGLGKTLAPIYTLLFDLAIKEALCRKQEDGNVYFVMDEFRLMNALSHMDNGINFGRSLGAKFIIGIQNVNQVFDVYGETAARSILSGFSTLISFSVSDDSVHPDS